MEWVESTSRTVDEAKDVLLDQLGVDEQDAEFVVVEEPKAGLFGRMRGQATVRARVAPKSPPSKDEGRRPRRKKPSSKDSGDVPRGTKPAKESGPVASESEGPKDSAQGGRKEAAARRGRDAGQRSERASGERDDRGELDVQVARDDIESFLSGFVDTFGETAEVSVEIDEEGAIEASISGSDLGRLIGPRGGVVAAIEELCRTRLQHLASGDRTPRLRLDVGGYRELRAEHLAQLVDETIAQVKETGQSHLLDVVLANERKLVHDQVGEHEGVATRSEGEDPYRKVAVIPAP